MICSLCSLSVLAVTEGEVQSQVAAQGKEAVTGNILIWFLCAVAFLKVSQKIDTFLSSLGINVGHTGGSMLGELMIAFKGIKGASGGAFGGSSGGHTTNNTSTCHNTQKTASTHAFVFLFFVFFHFIHLNEIK